MDEITRPGSSSADLKIDLPQESDITFSERDSVMLGEISPHFFDRDCFDSKSSSETPPSYNQLNYKENLQRFFDSHPITTLNEDTLKIDDSKDSNRASNISPVRGFGGNLSSGSSGSNAQMESITNTSTGTSSGSYQPPTLTEALLYKHNEDMEKQIIKKHKTSRGGGKGGEKNKKGPDKSTNEYSGVKRSASHSWVKYKNKLFALIEE